MSEIDRKRWLRSRWGVPLTCDCTVCQQMRFDARIQAGKWNAVENVRMSRRKVGRNYHYGMYDDLSVKRFLRVGRKLTGVRSMIFRWDGRLS